ncbi:Uncharacterised protein [Serratia liquefaciens]|nr:Uncharacterised protein [Serratia liquefaciens]
MYYLDNKSGVVIMPPPQDTQSDTPLWFSEDKDAPSYPGPTGLILSHLN